MVATAGPPEIFRALQRDETYLKTLQTGIDESVLHIFGVRTWVPWREHIRLGSKLLYYLLTTLGNLQTLGEEYTGIVHWSTENKHLPSKRAQTLMVLLDCFGEKFFDILLKRFENLVESNEELRGDAKNSLLSASRRLRSIIPIILRLHKAIFYLQGSYYQVSKRVTGVRYAIVRFWLKDRSLASNFRILGVVSFISAVFGAVQAFNETTTDTSRNEVQKGEESSVVGDVCSLCLNKRRNDSTTPCGHLFCWDCILSWLSEQPFCPLCRQEIAMSRIVLLRNL